MSKQRLSSSCRCFIAADNSGFASLIASHTCSIMFKLKQETPIHTEKKADHDVIAYHDYPLMPYYINAKLRSSCISTVARYVGFLKSSKNVVLMKPLSSIRFCFEGPLAWCLYGLNAIITLHHHTTTGGLAFLHTVACRP